MNEYKALSIVRVKPKLQGRRTVHVRISERDERELAHIKRIYREFFGRTVSTSVVVRRALSSLTGELMEIKDLTKQKAEKAELLDHVG